MLARTRFSTLLVSALAAALLCGCPNDEPDKDQPDVSDMATIDADDMGPDAPDSTTTQDLGAPDTGSDLGAADVGGNDASADVGPTDAGADTGGADAGADMATAIVCTDGPDGFFDDGNGNVGCDREVACDGVEYKIECLNDVCSCLVNSVPMGQTTATSCSNDGLEDCGAPLPPVNPTCYASDIYSGGGGGGGAGFCEAGVTCNDVPYVLNCPDGGACTCSVDGVSAASTATDCLTSFDELVACGAPLQPDP